MADYVMIELGTNLKPIICTCQGGSPTVRMGYEMGPFDHSAWFEHWFVFESQSKAQAKEEIQSESVLIVGKMESECLAASLDSGLHLFVLENF